MKTMFSDFCYLRTPVDTILCADHGEAFGEHGYQGHGESLYDSVIATPLIIAGPNIRPNRFSGISRNIDILPTVCALVDVESPANIDGVSLLSENPTCAYSESPIKGPETCSLRTEHGLMIWNLTENPEAPKEFSQIRESFHEQFSHERLSVSGEIAEQFHALGYLK